MGRINTKNKDGSEIRFLEIAKLWLRDGHRLRILAPDREISLLLKHSVIASNAIFDRVSDIRDSESNSIYNLFVVYGYRVFKSLWKKYPKNIDIVYIPSDFLFDLIPGLVCKLYNPEAKVIVCLFLVAPNPFKGYQNFYVEGKLQIPTLRASLYYLMQQISIFLAKKFKFKILVLNKIDEIVIKKHVDDVHVVPMGVDLNSYSYKEDTTSEFDAIFVGRIHPQKGLNDLIKIWKIVSEKLPNAKLALIGGGSQEDIKDLTNNIKISGLTKEIIFLGFKEGAEKIDFLRKSKIFMMPSRYESFAMTIIEAMAVGLPVCAYSLPVFQELYGQELEYANIGDYKKFSENIIHLVGNELYRKEKSLSALNFSLNYGWENISARELEIISNEK